MENDRWNSGHFEEVPPSVSDFCYADAIKDAMDLIADDTLSPSCLPESSSLSSCAVQESNWTIHENLAKNAVVHNTVPGDTATRSSVSGIVASTMDEPRNFMETIATRFIGALGTAQMPELPGEVATCIPLFPMLGQGYALAATPPFAIGVHNSLQTSPRFLINYTGRMDFLPSYLRPHTTGQTTPATWKVVKHLNHRAKILTLKPIQELAIYSDEETKHTIWLPLIQHETGQRMVEDALGALVADYDEQLQNKISSIASTPVLNQLNIDLLYHQARSFTAAYDDGASASIVEVTNFAMKPEYITTLGSAVIWKITNIGIDINGLTLHFIDPRQMQWGKLDKQTKVPKPPVDRFYSQIDTDVRRAEVRLRVDSLHHLRKILRRRAKNRQNHELMLRLQNQGSLSRELIGDQRSTLEPMAEQTLGSETIPLPQYQCCNCTN